MLWTLILAAVLAVYLYVKNKPKGAGEHVKCPYCKSENVNIGKRGYSFAQGAAMAVALFLIRLVVAGIQMKVSGDSINLDGMVVSPLLGLLMGFIGAKNLHGRCIACGKDFSL